MQRQEQTILGVCCTGEMSRDAVVFVYARDLKGMVVNYEYYVEDCNEDDGGGPIDWENEVYHETLKGANEGFTIQDMIAEH